jgi:hypothetical protein
MRRQRLLEYNDAKQKGSTRTAYINSIRTDYQRYDWIDRKGRLSPYGLLRHWEELWLERVKDRPNDPYLLLRQRKSAMRDKLGKHLNRGNLKSQKRTYNDRHHEDILESKRKYRETHADKIRKYKREYRLRKKNEAING